MSSPGKEARSGAGWFDGLTIPLLAPVALVSLLLLAVGIVSAWYVHWLQRNTSDLLAVDLRSVRAAEELVNTVQELRTQLDLYLEDKTLPHLDEVLGLRGRASEWLAEIGRLAPTDRERTLVAGLDAAMSRFWSELEGAARADEPEVITGAVRR